MKTKIQNQFSQLTTRLIRKNQDAPKYTIELPERPFTPETRGVQLGSYLKFASSIDRKEF